MKCLSCKKKLPKGRRKYCGSKCQQKSHYEKKKDYYKQNSIKWRNKNPEKHRKIMLKANRKFRTEKRERFNKLMRDEYYKHKPKWISRRFVYDIINTYKNKPNIDKFCEKCKKENNLSLKFEVYPKTSKDIRQAIKDKKIYYLCKECRYGK